MIGACALSFGIGSFLYVNALSKCSKGALFAVGLCTDNYTETERKISLERLNEYVGLFSRVKQLSKRFKFIKYYMAKS